MAKLFALFAAGFPAHSGLQRLDFIAEVEVDLPDDLTFEEAFPHLRYAAWEEAVRICDNVKGAVPELTEAGHDGL